MSTDRENAIKILSSLSPSIREAFAVYLDTSYAMTSSRVESSAVRETLDGMALEIRRLSK